MSACRVSRIQEAWSSESQTSGRLSWEKGRLEFTAFKGSEAYIGMLPLDEKRHWKIGVYENLEDSTFKALLHSSTRIPDCDIYPVFEAGLDSFDPSAANPQDYYLKLPNVSVWNRSKVVAELMLAEARVNQMFLAEPHVNLGTYLGCVLHEGRIVQLAFPYYLETLSDRVIRAKQEGSDCFPANEQEKCLNGIRAAVRHIHSMGYAHNDISACNILFDRNENAVLIDLDSCTLIGETLKKGGIVGGWRGPFFWGKEFKYLSIDCDELSLQYIADWLSDMSR